MLNSLRRLNIGEILFLTCVLAVSFVFTAATANAGVVSAHFTSVSGNNQNGEYTYPYYISLDGGSAIPMMCDDFSHGSAVGDIWLGNVTLLSSEDLINLRFGDYEKYVEAAFLMHQLSSSDTQEWSNISWAVWQIFNPQLNPGSGPSGTLGPEYWYNLAESADLASVNIADIAILTPVDAHSLGGDQEFLFVTPEPGALLLIGTGFVVIWWKSKRFV